MVDAFVAASAEIQPEVNDRIEGLRHCVEKLSQRHRLLIELRYAKQQPSDAIAEQIGGNAASIDAMLYRLRNALKDCIAKHMEATR